MRNRWFLPAVCLSVGTLLGMIAHSSLIGQIGNQPFPNEVASYRDIVKKVLPAVVSIESRGMVRQAGGNAQLQPFGRMPSDVPGLPEEFRKFFEEFNNPRGIAPREIPRRGFGSGFIIDSDGVILTNYHVVGGADEVTVTLADGRKFTTKEVVADRKTDLAIVRIEVDEALPTLRLGDSDKMEVGDRVLAVGAPFGLTGSVTEGIVSAKSRDLRLNFYNDFVQTDAAINPGNSGGPLVNLAGEVIGINSAIKSRSGGFQGVGLAISSNLARSVQEQLQKFGEVRRGYLGVQVKDLDREVAERLGLPNNQGAVVTRVFDGSPAAKAGVEPGDVITTLDKQPIGDGGQLQDVVLRQTVGEPTTITIFRQGETQQLSITIEKQPESYGLEDSPLPPQRSRPNDEVSLDAVGLQTRDLTPELAGRLGYDRNEQGALITAVEPNSLASQAGLTVGTVIVRVDGQKIANAQELRQALTKASPEKGALLLVRTTTGTDFVVLRLQR